jgi:prepilin-type N-terminal cleavage/methylation domain-containing protein
MFVKSRGFTLIEVLIVLLIMGIISVAVMPKWTGTGTNVNYEARRVLNDIRYAQGMSITTGQRYRWVKLSSTTYQITDQSGTAIILPSGVSTLTLSGGATIGTLSNLPNSLIAFNSQGIPYTTTALPGTALAATASIPISGGGITRTIQISPETGYGVLT